jgi:pimeloyl-ACP methyl ester carboxylesterase
MQKHTLLTKSLSAFSVILATCGCMNTGPNIPQTNLEHLRKFTLSDAPLSQEISYLRSPLQTGVPVIYVHGTPGSAQAWVNYVEHPVEASYSIAIDRPGFGQSHPAGAVISLQSQASAVLAVMPSDNTPVILVGHSLGGAVVAQVAAEHPERIKAIVFLASSLDPAQEKIHPLQPLGQIWPFRSLLSRPLRNANDELMQFKAQLLMLEPLLKHIEAPVIIVHGTQDDLVPFANVAYLQEKLSKARCVKTVTLENQNHFLPWNSETRVREAIAWAIKPDC